MSDITRLDPGAMMRRYMTARRLWAASDADDVISDAFLAIAMAMRSWQEGAGRSLLSWCWLHMDQEVARGRKLRAIHYARTSLIEDIPDIERMRIDVVDPGFKQVEDRLLLQRWADMVHLTDLQADAVAWMAVHAGTWNHGVGRQTGVASINGARSHYRAALAKLRRVAAA